MKIETPFALDIVEESGLPLPSLEHPVRSLEPYIVEAWDRSGLKDFVGQFMDVANLIVDILEEPLEVAKQLTAFTDLIPVEAIPFASAVFRMSVDAISSQHKRQVLEGRRMQADGIAYMAGLYEDNPKPWVNEVSVPTYMDCSDWGNARARTVIAPQKMPAPWRPGVKEASEGANNYPQPSGNCGKGFAVWCNFADAPFGKKKPGADGKRCSGRVDISLLLYPYWTGAREPGPAPAFFYDDPDPYNFYPDVNTNAMMIAEQAKWLGTLGGNFSVRLQDVLDMRENIISLAGEYIDMRVANPAEDYVLTDQRLEVAKSMCDAFIAARASFVQSEKALGMALLPANYVKWMDPAARVETLLFHLPKSELPPNMRMQQIVPRPKPPHKDLGSLGVGYTPDLSGVIAARYPRPATSVTEGLQRPRSGSGLGWQLGAAALIGGGIFAARKLMK